MAQEHKFSVHMAGKQIGNISASLSKEKDSASYTIVSEVNFKVLWKKYHRTTSSQAIYKNSALVYGYADVYMNNHLEDSSTTIVNPESRYDCFRYPDKNFQFENDEVTFTTSKLYFHEPKGISEVYSERYHEYCKIEPGKHPNTYILYLPSGKENVYKYVDSFLVEVIVERTWFDLVFRKINPDKDL